MYRISFITRHKIKPNWTWRGWLTCFYSSSKGQCSQHFSEKGLKKNVMQSLHGSSWMTLFLETFIENIEQLPASFEGRVCSESSFSWRSFALNVNYLGSRLLCWMRRMLIKQFCGNSVESFFNHKNCWNMFVNKQQLYLTCHFICFKITYYSKIFWLRLVHLEKKTFDYFVRFILGQNESKFVSSTVAHFFRRDFSTFLFRPRHTTWSKTRRTVSSKRCPRK